MAPMIPSAEIRLSFPPYACDFDPQDGNRLIVGGGGGPGRSGVANKVSVLDVSHQDAIQIDSELELSRDEDSVNTIAVGPRRRNSILIYAGINSSPADIEKGKNEHFRVFSADQPSKGKAKAAGPKIAELSRSSLFSSKDQNTYQRLLRISPPGSGPQHLGAIATGDAKDPQIVLFDIPSPGSAPKSRGNLDLEKEAVDLDILQVSDDEFQLIYCSGYDIYTMSIGKKPTEPQNIFTMPTDESTGQRPAFRSIRFLTPTFAIASANLPKAGGVILQGFRLPKTPGAEGKEGWARLAISAKLPKPVTRATGMAVRNLSPPASPSAKQLDAQFAIAVSAQDSSITLYTLDHQVLGDISLIVNLYPVTTLKAVHPAPISGLAFSYFTPPKAPTMRPHHLKLASIGSMGNTCIVHSIPLKKFIDKSSSSSSSRRAAGPPRQPRYILAFKGRDPIIKGLVTFVGFFILLAAVLIQGLMEIKGVSRPILGAKYVTPTSWHAEWKIHDPHNVLGNNPVSGGRETGGVGGTGGWLADVLSENQQTQPFVFLDARKEEDGLGYQMVKHDEGMDEHRGAIEWEKLPGEQREAWKVKLKKAGHWGEEVGEAVFKGVLFGEIAGVVGGIVRG